MISVTFFRQGKVVIVDAENSTQKNTLLDLVESFDNSTTVDDMIQLFESNELYYVVGDDDIEFEVVGSRPGTIKR